MDQQEQSASPDAGQQTSEDTTLEQVYQQFNVEEKATDFNPAPQQPQVAPAPAQPPSLGAEIPDPVLDPNGFRAYLARTTSQTAQMLQQTTQHQQRLYAAELRRQEEADIKQAVSLVKEKIGGEVDDDFIEIAMGQKARKDARFAQLFANRSKNPAAWRAALSAVGNELKSKVSFRTDPQISENVRAAKQSTQSSMSSRESDDSNPLEARLASAKSQAAFDAEWSRMMNGG